MASTRDIRRRIRGVRNIQQVTRAMSMIAAARLRRAQQQAESGRPYVEKLSQVLRDIEAAGGEAQHHPLLRKRKVSKIAVLVITSDRGLCGAFNSATIAKATGFIESQKLPVALLVVGKKGLEHFRRRGFVILRYFPQPSRELRAVEISAIAGVLTNDFTLGEYDQLHLCHTRFETAVRHTPTVTQLLPVDPEKVVAEWTYGGFRHRTPHQYEPPAAEILGTMVPLYVEAVLRQALAESLASEQAARMVAMKNATDSAMEMIDSLRMQYNRARQARITKELLEVVSGAEALRQPH